MDKYVIDGGKQLHGSVILQSAKNAVLPLFAASILTEKRVVIRDAPNISDVTCMAQILRELGAEVSFSDGNVTIDSANASCHEISSALTKELRSSVFMLGSLLTRFHRALIAYPGGCDIGLRPIDLHRNALKQLGVSISERDGFIFCACDRLRGAEILLDFPSVGATENILLAAVKAEGRTVLTGAAKEPEIVDLQNFLNAMGAKVRGAGGSVITVEGVKSLHGVEYTPIPDRIVAGTYLIGAAMCGGELVIGNACAEHISSLIAKIPKSTCKIYPRDDKIFVSSEGRHKAVPKIETMYYPGFPTDLQAQMMALQSISDGTSVIVENIFETRFKTASQLCKMGADITVSGSTAVVRGAERLYGAQVTATDLRGGASLVLAAMAAQGVSEIDDIHHIDRGYEDLAEILPTVGVRISRVG